MGLQGDGTYVGFGARIRGNVTAGPGTFGSTLTDGFDLLVPPSWTRTKRYQVNDDLDRPTALFRFLFFSPKNGRIVSSSSSRVI